VRAREKDTERQRRKERTLTHIDMNGKKEEGYAGSRFFSPLSNRIDVSMESE